jgi:hypothetical protein
MLLVTEGRERRSLRKKKEKRGDGEDDDEGDDDDDDTMMMKQVNTWSVRERINNKRENNHSYELTWNQKRRSDKPGPPPNHFDPSFGGAKDDRYRVFENGLNVFIWAPL